MPLIQERVWLVEATLIDNEFSRLFLGIERGARRLEHPRTTWDWIVCMRTVQFATRELAEARIDELMERSALLPVGTTLRPIQEDREYVVATITMVHAPDIE